MSSLSTPVGNSRVEKFRCRPPVPWESARDLTRPSPDYRRIGHLINICNHGDFMSLMTLGENECGAGALSHANPGVAVWHCKGTDVGKCRVRAFGTLTRSSPPPPKEKRPFDASLVSRDACWSTTIGGQPAPPRAFLPAPIIRVPDPVRPTIFGFTRRWGVMESRLMRDQKGSLSPGRVKPRDFSAFGTGRRQTVAFRS